MKTVVVGYDGTDTARLAVLEAAALARAFDAELHLVHVVDDDRLRQGMITADVQEHSEAAAAAQIDALLSPAGLKQEIADLTTHVEVVSGAAARCILDYVSSIGADLIVVGNRRVQGIERLLGSVAIDVLRHAPCSVYVAHTG